MHVCMYVCMYVFNLVMFVLWCVSVHHRTGGHGRLSELSGFDLHTDAAVNWNFVTVKILAGFLSPADHECGLLQLCHLMVAVQLMGHVSVGQRL